MGVQIINVPALCPKCGARTCAEWNFVDPPASLLHCRAQHANQRMCDYSMPLGVEPGHDGYTITSSGVPWAEISGDGE